MRDKREALNLLVTVIMCSSLIIMLALNIDIYGYNELLIAIVLSIDFLSIAAVAALFSDIKRNNRKFCKTKKLCYHKGNGNTCNYKYSCQYKSK